ncbi:MAG: hypothetical protein ACIAQF_13770 [Phycisphaerales bacterium JB065]
MTIQPVIFIIFGVIVGGILLLSFISNALGAVFGPWAKLAQEWPATDIPTDRKPQTASFSVTSEPYTIAMEVRHRRFSWIFGMSGFFGIAALLLIVAMIVGWVQSPIYLQIVLIAIMLLFYGSLAYWVIRFLRTKAFPQLVQFHATTDHLHFRKDSDIITKYPWISIPWVAIDEISPDPFDPDRVRFHMGPYWAYADRVLVEQEMNIRAELGGDGLPASSDDPRDPGPLPRPTDWF